MPASDGIGGRCAAFGANDGFLPARQRAVADYALALVQEV